MPLNVTEQHFRPRAGFLWGCDGQTLRWIDFTTFLATEQYLTDDQGNLILDSDGNKIIVNVNPTKAQLPYGTLIVNP